MEDVIGKFRQRNVVRIRRDFRRSLRSGRVPSTLRDSGSLLFLLGERREEPLLASARYPIVHARTTSASVTRNATSCP